MRKIAVLAAALVILAASQVRALEIVGPKEPIEPKEYAQVEVKGLTPAALADAKLIYFPRDNVNVIAGQSWGGAPFVLFRAKAAGKYLIAVTIVEGGKLVQAECCVDVAGVAPKPPDPPPTPPSENPFQPAQQYQALVRPVSGLSLSRSDATSLANLFGTLSRDVAAGTAASTTAELRKALIDRGGKLALKGKYAGLAMAIDKVLGDSLGLEVAPLDRPQAAALLITIAWAVWETGKGGAP